MYCILGLCTLSQLEFQATAVFLTEFLALSTNLATVVLTSLLNLNHNTLKSTSNTLCSINTWIIYDIFDAHQ